MRKLFVFSLFITLLCLCSGLQALDDNSPLEESRSNDESLLEIEGLIIDRTMTRLGKDFYFSFSMLMNNQYGDLEVNLTIAERPTALSGSIITIFHFDRILYRTALSPVRHQAEQKAEEAMYAVRNYIIKWKTEKLFMDTFDLERSEL